MGKKLIIGLVALLLTAVPIQAKENTNLVGTVLTSPVVWTQQTLEFCKDVIGIPFGLDKNSQENWNYSGQGGKYGYYESFSDESAYRFNRWGVN